MVTLLKSIGQTQRVNRGVFFDWPKDQIPEGGLSDGQNVEPLGVSPEFGSIGKVPGYVKYSSTAAPGTGPVMLIAEFVTSAGVRFQMICTMTRLSEYNAGTNVYDDLTGGANLLTGTSANPIFWGALNDLFILTNGINNVKKSSGTTWADLGGTPPKFLGLDIYEGHVLGWNVNPGTGPEYRVQWSGLNLPETWTVVAGEEQGSLDLRDHNLLAILAGGQLGRQYLLYKEQLGGVYALTYVGLPLVMVQELVIPKLGVFSPKGVAAHGGVHYVMASDEKLYAVTQGGQEPIAHGLWKRLFSRLNWDARRAAWVAVNPQKSQVMFVIPEGASTVANRAYLFNYQTGACGEREFPFMTAALVRDPETTTINDLSGTIDALTGSIDDLSGVGKDTFFMGGEGSSAYAYRLGGSDLADGVNIEAYATTPWIGRGDGRVLRVRGFEADGDFIGYTYAELGTLDMIGAGKTAIFIPSSTNITAETGNRVDFNNSARYIAAKVRGLSGTGQWEMRGYRWDVVSVGRR